MQSPRMRSEHKRVVVWLMLLAACALFLGGIEFVAATHMNDAGQLTYEATLSGEKEIPAVDTDAAGSLSLLFGTTTATTTTATTTATSTVEQASFELDVSSGFGIIAAHLHCAPVDENGPIVVTLFSAEAATSSATTTSATSTDVDGRLSTGTFTDANIEATAADCTEPIADIMELIQEIEEGDIYVNVHSTSSPAGLIRGQVVPDPQHEDGNDNGTTTPPNINPIEAYIQERLRTVEERLQQNKIRITERLEEIWMRINERLGR